MTSQHGAISMGFIKQQIHQKLNGIYSENSLMARYLCIPNKLCRLQGKNN